MDQARAAMEGIGAGIVEVTTVTAMATASRVKDGRINRTQDRQGSRGSHLRQGVRDSAWACLLHPEHLASGWVCLRLLHQHTIEMARAAAAIVTAQAEVVVATVAVVAAAAVVVIVVDEVEVLLGHLRINIEATDKGRIGAGEWVCRRTSG
jgi:hypothetical protein